MSEQPAFLLVFTTCPDAISAERVALAVLQAQAAACVNILPPATSLYWWKGQIERASEPMLVIKTRADAYPRLEEAIRAVHPYELPEVIAVPVAEGLPAYLAWVAENAMPDAPAE